MIKGAICGGIAGLVVNLWIGIGALVYKPYYPKKPISVTGCLALYQNVTGKVYEESDIIDFYSSSRLLAHK